MTIVTETNIDPLRWQQISSYLGQDLLSYMLGGARESQVSDMSKDQQDSAAVIVSALSAANVAEWDSIRRSDVIMQTFCTFSPALGRTLATTLHFKSGGAIPDVESEDELEAYLCQLALDAFPGLLVNLIHDGFTTTVPMFMHPLRELASHVMFRREEPLMAVFADADFEAGPNPSMENPTGLSTYTSWSDGSRGTVQFLSLVQTILQKASGAPLPGKSDLESYVASVRESLALARELAAGKEVTLLALAGCPGTSLTEGTSELRLGEGRLRPMGIPEKALIREAASNAVVLEIPIRVTLEELAKDHQSFDTTIERLMSKGQEFHQQVMRKISQARMSILLASKEGETLVTGQSFISWSNPIDSGHQQIHSPNPWRPSLYYSRSLQAEDEPNIQHWETLLSKAPKGLFTGQERLLSAVNERNNPFDGFIDAVIVWENLFGGRTETMLRVCGSLAHVLEPTDAEKRHALFKATKTLYEKRSRLVHGSDETIKYADAHEYWKVSIQHAIGAWRKVLESDELRDQETSEKRGIAVLIGGLSS